LVRSPIATVFSSARHEDDIHTIASIARTSNADLPHACHHSDPLLKVQFFASLELVSVSVF
jgi:hypothetical protein